MSTGSTNLSSSLSVSGSFTSNPLASNVEKDKDSLWYFTADQLANSPSRRHGIDADQELSYRQMTAYLIQEMGQRLQVSQLCINTAIVYMHRFYAFHSFTHFHRNGIAAASLFLAAKVEEQPRKLEHVIKAANKCLNQPTSSTTDPYFNEQAADLVFNENVLLQTLGFDVAIDHPHTHVVKTCHLVKACKDLAQTSYFLASNSLHLTSMCLQYKPTVVACFCIYLACKWSRWEIPQSTEGKHWFHYVDKTVTMDLLKQLTDEFIAIYEKSPARLKSKLNSIKALAQGASNRVVNKDKKAKPEDWKMVDMMKMYHSSINTNESNNAAASSNLVSITTLTSEQQHQQSGQVPLLPPPPPHSQQQIRRQESHTSQHRSHHSSSASHHHSKQIFATNDVTDPKSSTNHKQQHSTSSNNRPRDHSQYSQNLNAIPIAPSSTSGSRSNASAGNSSNNNSSRPVMPSGVLSQKLSSQQHDTSYHKSRDRNCLPASSNPAASLLPSHKIPQKAEISRLVSKEHIGRMSDPNKPANSKIFVSGNVSQSGSSQLLSGVDVSRNVMQQHQRQPSSVYHQPTISRTGNSKHEQSMAVQVLQSQHKHPSSLEPQFNSKSSEYLVSQQPLLTNPNSSHSTSRATDATQNGDEANNESTQIYSSMIPFQGYKGQNHQSQQPTKMSTFSPELNETIQHQQLVIASSSKKVERERSLGTPTKKERNRIPYVGIDIANQSATASKSSSQSMQKLQIQKKLETSNVSNVLAGTSSTSYSGIKRQNDNAPIMQEEDLNRDSKIRKLESQTVNQAAPNCNDLRTANDSNKLQIVNGIETNPDMVRNLLKEGLCTTNALIKSELPPPSIQFHPPLQLLEPAANMQIMNEKTVATIQVPMEVDDTAGGKSEKKKKKDKHKHKEKDKSKDREERKKHKKEKDKHKDRDLEISEPVKIKISKEKLETSSNTTKPLGFKIQISKDRIIGDLSSSSGSNFANSAIDNSKNANISSPPALKIKISKDKLENYSSGSSDSATTSFNSSHNQSLINTNPQVSGVMSNNSSRKKDRERDRDRDKEKKRNSLEHTKSNANGSGVMIVGGNQYIQSSSCSKSTSSSKIQQYSNNMSQLFGESNDDDDEDDRTYQRPKKSSLLKSVNSVFSSTQNYQTPSKSNLEMVINNDGSFSMQQQQQQHHHHQQQQYHPHQQRQIYHKK